MIWTDRAAVVLAAPTTLLFLITNPDDPGRVYAGLLLAITVTVFVGGRAIRWIIG